MKYILPHLYVFFGVILFILANFVIPTGKIYWISSYGSILFMIIGLIWIFFLLFKKKIK